MPDHFQAPAPGAPGDNRSTAVLPIGDGMTPISPRCGAAANASGAPGSNPGTATPSAAPTHAISCTCPSGDGSLRWPCPVHPAASALSHQQECVLRFMYAFFRHNHQLPRLTDISAAFSWHSPNAAHEHVQRLERKGMLERNEIGLHKFSDAGLTYLAKHPAGAAHG